MPPLRRLEGRVAPLPRRDIDTDQIIPKQFLKRLERTGYGPYLFYDWRTAADGSSEPSFVLNQPQYAGASILAAGSNFGCGSSREHAAWALRDFGFAAIVAPSFADIFRANAVANGLLPVALPDHVVSLVTERAQAIEGYTLTIDLEQCQVADRQGLTEAFAIEPADRHRLLEGLDDIGIILTYEADIARHEARRP